MYGVVTILLFNEVKNKRKNTDEIQVLTVYGISYFIIAIKHQEKEINFFLKIKISEDLEKDMSRKGTRSYVYSLSRLKKF